MIIQRQRHSVWTTPAMPGKPLTADATADVCITGAGIAGLSVAHELQCRGLSVAILDDGPIGGGETSHTTAHLCSALDDRLYRLERMFGRERAALAVGAHRAAVDRIERLCAAEGIACNFRCLDGYLLRAAYLEANQAESLLDQELQASHRAGLRCERVDSAPGLAGSPWPALRFRDQAQFSPLRYLHGLAMAFVSRGGRIYTPCHATEFRGGRGARVVCAHGPSIEASHLVIATNTPVNDRVVIHTKQSAHRTYVVAFAVPRPPIEALWWDGYWDPDEPYHYVRFAPDEAGESWVLIVGGEDHKTGQAADGLQRWDRLENWARTFFPTAGEVVSRWSGQIMEPHDELGFIGRNPGDQPNVYIVTGDSGNGMTYGTIAAELIPDLIQGKPNPLAEIFSPARLPLAAPVRAAKDNVNTLAQYSDWVASKHHGPDEPHIARRGLHPVAMCDGPDGPEACSAVCPHLGGVVRWNPAEQSWDCPCHGSRFDRSGRVINGPANENLRPLTGAATHRPAPPQAPTQV